MHVAVVGGGVVGLSCAFALRRGGADVTVYERGRVGEHVQRWGHVRLFSPFGLNTTPLGRAALRAENPKHDLPGDQDCVTGQEHVAAYLEPLAMTGKLIDCLNRCMVSSRPRGNAADSCRNGHDEGRNHALLIIRSRCGVKQSLEP